MELGVLKQQPEWVERTVKARWQAMQESGVIDAVGLDRLQQYLSADELLQAQLVRCWGGSDYVAELCCRRPELLTELIASGDLQRPYPAGELRHKLDALLAEVETEDQLAFQLRRFRQREQVRIIWRDLNRQASMVETTAELSAMADAAIDAAYQWLYGRCTQDWGCQWGLRRTRRPGHSTWWCWEWVSWEPAS